MAATLELRAPELLDFTAEHEDVSSCKGIIWFPEKADQRIWKRLLRLRGRGIRISLNGLTVGLETVTGSEIPPGWGKYAFRLVYLPAAGISGNPLRRRALRAKATYPLRILRKQELGLHVTELSPLTGLWSQLRSESAESPFLGVQDDSTGPQMRRWLMYIVAGTLLEGRPTPCWRDLAPLCQEARRFLAEDPPQRRLASRADVGRALAIRWCGRRLRDDLTGKRRRLEAHRDFRASYRDRMEEAAVKSYEQSGQQLYGVHFKFNLGDELLAGLYELNQKLKGFADRLAAHREQEIRDIGNGLLEVLSYRPPILALVGSFSSGKTTLLNWLLFGRGSRGFRTQNIHNTAIVHLIELCPPGEEERAQLVFREVVDHEFRFIGGYLDGDFRNFGALLRLIEDRVLGRPHLMLYERGKSEPSSHLTETADVKEYFSDLVAAYGSDRSRPDLERVLFTASVNLKTLKSPIWEKLFPGEISLATTEDWRSLLVDDLVLEKPEAAFLVEEIRIWLKNRLLDLTAIADTPGTGSMNDRHDLITEQHLEQANGIILLLPTQNAEAGRVQETLDKVYRHLNSVTRGHPLTAFNRVAFVVNCFTFQDEASVKSKTEDFAQAIREKFGISRREWKERLEDHEGNNFFVVQLKKAEAGQNLQTLHGYPSLKPLKRWVKGLFRAGAYQEKYDRVVALLEEEWNERRDALRHLSTTGQHSDLAKRIRGLEGFLGTGLNKIVEDYRVSHRLQVEQMDYLYREVGRILRGLVEQCTEIKVKELESCRRSFDSHLQEWSQEVDRYRRTDYAGDLVREMRLELRRIDRSLPRLLPKAPPRRRVNASLGRDALGKRFAEMIESWPDSIIAVVLKWLKGTTRLKLAEGLQGYCEAQINKFSKALGDYTAETARHLESLGQGVRDRLKREVNNLKRSAPHREQKRLKHILAAMEGLSQERDQVMSSLREELGNDDR